MPNSAVQTGAGRTARRCQFHDFGPESRSHAATPRLVLRGENGITSMEEILLVLLYELRANATGPKSSAWDNQCMAVVESSSFCGLVSLSWHHTPPRWINNVAIHLQHKHTHQWPFYWVHLPNTGSFSLLPSEKPFYAPLVYRRVIIGLPISFNESGCSALTCLISKTFSPSKPLLTGRRLFSRCRHHVGTNNNTAFKAVY